ncbi:MAG TPA: Rv2175c family DNA-binding protein [Frankiaceae bacterium]|nr:Rv2175c family DNA-binding protein [Frankiaceae bacterium]
MDVEWASVPDIAEALGVEVTKVRQYLREGKLLAVRADGDGPLRIPAAFVQDGQIVKHLPGVITVLRDARYGDEEAVRWLFTDDDLPGPPIEALRANRGTEVKRRAQALGF